MTEARLIVEDYHGPGGAMADNITDEAARIDGADVLRPLGRHLIAMWHLIHRVGAELLSRANQPVTHAKARAVIERVVPRLLAGEELEAVRNEFDIENANIGSGKGHQESLSLASPCTHRRAGSPDEIKTIDDAHTRHPKIADTLLACLAAAGYDGAPLRAESVQAGCVIKASARWFMELITREPCLETIAGILRDMQGTDTYLMKVLREHGAAGLATHLAISTFMQMFCSTPCNAAKLAFELLGHSHFPNGSKRGVRAQPLTRDQDSVFLPARQSHELPNVSAFMTLALYAYLSYRFREKRGWAAPEDTSEEIARNPKRERRVEARGDSDPGFDHIDVTDSAAQLDSEWNKLIREHRPETGRPFLATVCGSWKKWTQDGPPPKSVDFIAKDLGSNWQFLCETDASFKKRVRVALKALGLGPTVNQRLPIAEAIDNGGRTWK